MFARILDHCVELAWPSRCAGCDEPSAGRLFCDACAMTLDPGAGACCPRCGAIWLCPPPGGGHHLCGECLRSSPPWLKARAAYAYGGALRIAIARWKTAPDHTLGPHLAALMLSQAEVAGWSSLPDHTLVVPVPSHRRRLLRRGFNPAGVLARAFARRLRLPFRPTAMLARRPIPAAKDVGRSQRLSRVRGAFAARSSALDGRMVLLVDDVMTTGATARAATRACLKAGALGVEVAVLARVTRD